MQRNLILKVVGAAVAAGVIGAGIGFAVSDSPSGTGHPTMAVANAGPAPTTQPRPRVATMAPQTVWPTAPSRKGWSY